MSLPRIARLVAFVSVVLALPACVDEPLPQPSWCEGQPDAVDDPGGIIGMWSFGVPLGELCSGSWERGLEHAEWVTEIWGVGERFGYAIYDSAENACWPCPDYAEACAAHGGVHSTIFPDRHEITHAVRPRPCFSLIEEGFAELYGDPFRVAGSTGPFPEVLQLIDERGSLEGSYYGEATRFVAFLIERAGVEPLRRLCDYPITNTADFDLALQEVYGEPLDAIVLAYEDYPDDVDHLPWSLRQDLACEVGDQSVLTSPTSWTMDMRCGSPGVEGRRGSWLMTHQLVDIPESGVFGFTFTADRPLIVEIELRNCTRVGLASIYTILSTGAAPTGTLEAGVPWSFQTDEGTPAGLYVLRVRIRDIDDADAPSSIDDTIMLDIDVGPIP